MNLEVRSTALECVADTVVKTLVCDGALRAACPRLHYEPSVPSVRWKSLLQHFAEAGVVDGGTDRCTSWASPDICLPLCLLSGFSLDFPFLECSLNGVFSR